MLGPERAVRLLLLLALVLAHVFLSLRSALSSGPRPFATGCWQQLARWCHAARRLVTYHHESIDAEEEDDTARAITKVVADAVQQRKVAVRRVFCSITLHVASLFVVVFTSLHVFWEEGGSPSVPAFIIHNTCYLLLLLYLHCPGERSWQTSRLVIVTIALIIQINSGLNQQDLVSATLFRFAVVTPVRIAGSIVVLDTPYVCVANAASSVLFGITIYRLEDLDGLAGSRVQVCLGDLVATLFIFACSSFFEHHVITSCRHAVELKASKNEAYATAKVLNKMCDAVVHLDEDARVAAADASLAALLLHGRGCIQAGTDFLQYLHNQEEHRPFRDWLKVSPNPCEEHVTFETRLRDSAGSAIAVEMFNVPFETITGASRNFLGIREKVLPGNAHPYDGHLQLNEDGVTALRGFASTSRRPRRSYRERRSPAASGSSSSSGSDTRSELQEIDSCPVFQFDAAALEILDYSPGFLFGPHRPPPRGSGLLTELPDCDVNREFLRSYDVCASDMIQRSRASLQPVEAWFDSAIVFECSGDLFRVVVNVKMEAYWEPGADPGDQEQLPRAVGTAKVLSVVRDQDCLGDFATSSDQRRIQL